MAENLVIEKDLSELLHILPVTILLEQNTVIGRWFRQSELLIRKMKTGEWTVQYENPNSGQKSVGFTDQSISRAVARMIIFLQNNQLLPKVL